MATKTDFSVSFDQSRIILGGDLDGSPQMLREFGEALRRAPKFSRMTVEAQDARITPEGVTAWIEGVQEYLMGSEMIYAPSQLGIILQFDSRYQHPASSYREYQRSHSDQHQSAAAMGEANFV